MFKTALCSLIDSLTVKGRNPKLLAALVELTAVTITDVSSSCTAELSNKAH